MRNFALRLLKGLSIGVILLIVLSSIIYRLQLDDSYRYYEDTNLLEKIDYYHQNKSSFGTLIIGSSRLFRQVNPVLLDSLLPRKDGLTYNASVPALRPFRSIDYIDYLEIDSTVDYLLVELLPPTRFYDNINSYPTIHSISADRLGIILDFAVRSNIDMKAKVYYAGSYTWALICKYLGVGLKKRLSALLGWEDYIPSESFYDLGKTRGFLTFKEHLSIQKEDKLMQRRDAFENKSEEVLSGYIKEALDDERKHIKSRSDAFVTFLNTKTEELGSRGIETIFIITPRLKSRDIRYMESIKSNLKSPVVDMSYSKRYPEFFQYEYSYDDIHLNEKGADFFTRQLAIELQAIL